VREKMERKKSKKICAVAAFACAQRKKTRKQQNQRGCVANTFFSIT
jgi:hypothetical protein